MFHRFLLFSAALVFVVHLCVSFKAVLGWKRLSDVVWKLHSVSSDMTSHTAKIPFLCVCSTCDSQDAFLFWMFCHTMSKGDLLLCGHPCYVGWVFFGTWIGCHTYYKSFCAFWFLLFFYPILVSVCPRLAIKLCLETFTFLMTGAIHWMAGL